MASSSSSSSRSEPPYLGIARRKKAEQQARISPAWRIDSQDLPHDPPRAEDGLQNVLDAPRRYLSRREVQITESYSVQQLLDAMKQKKLAAVEVADAFCHRAAVAHQLTNCLTEIMFDKARDRAEHLDQHLKTTGQPFGPLHGLPISVKDGFNVTGFDSSLGMAALCYKPAKSNSVLVDLLLSLGCVIIAKTNIPQTLAALDSINNIFGRTMNPMNRHSTAGGSSGGEGVLTAMKGNMIGWGTDIGGSIRIPAMCNGVYGLKPSAGRIPYGSQASLHIAGESRAGVQSVAGPLARSVQDIEHVMREVMPRAGLFGEDCIPSQWHGDKLQSFYTSRKVAVGILRSDGNCELLPPIAHVMNDISTALKSTGKIEVIDLPTPKAWTRCQSVVSKLMSIDGSQRLAEMIKTMQEPLVPWMESRFRSGEPRSLPEIAQLQATRTELEREMLKIWYQQDKHGRRSRKIDFVICPVAPHPVPPIDKYNATGYTSSWVLLDYPTGVVPVRDVRESDLQLGKAVAGKAISSWDERCRDELWDESKINRKIYLGTKLSVQVVSPRLEEEKLIQAMKIVDQAAKGLVRMEQKAKL